MGRVPCCDKASVKKGPWSSEEDDILKTYIHKYGTGGNWIALPNKMGLRRCGKSCRLRWLNYLRPNLKHGGFTEEEENIICTLYISIGSRWSIIAAQLPGRTDNDIKNYWNTRLKKKLFGRRKQVNMKSFEMKEDISTGNVQMDSEMSNSALERLQFHMQLQCTPSLYDSHPALWPWFNTLVQQRMIQSGLQLEQTLECAGTAHSDGEHKTDFYDRRAALQHDSPTIFSTMKMDEDGPQPIYSDHNLMLSSSSSYSDSSVAVAQMPRNNMEGSCNMPQHQDHTSQFNYFKDNMVWFSNYYNMDDDTPSGPSVSWDVATGTSFLHSADQLAARET